MDEKFFRQLIQMAIAQSKLIVNEQEALEMKELYPKWVNRIGKEVNVGEFYRYEDRLYKCIQFKRWIRKYLKKNRRGVL